MIPQTPDAIIDRNLDRATELLALKMLASGTDDEINTFVENIHRRLDVCIDRTLRQMEQKLRIDRALLNPKIATK